MNIGIFTFHRANNYGAVLQNFALIKAINKLNPKSCVYTIDFRNEILETPYKNMIFANDKNLAKRIYHSLLNIVNYQREKKLISSFDRFRSEKLNMTSSIQYCDLHENNIGMDLYITGSDQVWNEKIVGEKYEYAYVLDFIHDSIKISYAASSGHSKNLNKMLIPAIAELDGISVREKELQTYLSMNIGKTISCVVDPVFLLNASEWNALLDKSLFLDFKYIFVYCIGDKFPEVAQIANKIAQENGYKIVYFDKKSRYGKLGINAYGIGPLDFVRAIRDAEIIVASSFHATAFSIIFNKKYVAVPRSGTGVRITELVNTVGQNSMCCDTYSEYLTKYSYKESDLTELSGSIIYSLRYLNSYLELNYEKE